MANITLGYNQQGFYSTVHTILHSTSTLTHSDGGHLHTTPLTSLNVNDTWANDLELFQVSSRVTTRQSNFPIKP